MDDNKYKFEYKEDSCNEFVRRVNDFGHLKAKPDIVSSADLDCPSCGIKNLIGMPYIDSNCSVSNPSDKNVVIEIVYYVGDYLEQSKYMGEFCLACADEWNNKPNSEFGEFMNMLRNMGKQEMETK